MKISKGLKQAYQLQDFTFDAALALKASLTKEDGTLKIARDDASAIVSLVKAWEGCQERIRIHRGKPLPGSLRPMAAKKLKRPSAEIGPISAAPSLDNLPMHPNADTA